MARKNLPICVLDDQADLVDLTTDRLTKLGFPAVGTTNPQDALQKIRLGGCRAVIADFKMPAMDGLAFLEKILQYDPGVYLILVTGYYSVGRRDRRHQAWRLRLPREASGFHSTHKNSRRPR